MADRDPRVTTEDAAKAALDRTRRMYAGYFMKDGSVRAGSRIANLTQATQYKIRYVLQQALIKRFRTWKAILADRHIVPQPYENKHNRANAEVEARQELAEARRAAPAISHHKQPGGNLSFDVPVERPNAANNARPNVALGPRYRNSLVGRGIAPDDDDDMVGGRAGWSGKSHFVRRLLGDNARWFHTAGLPAHVAPDAPVPPNAGPGGLYVRRLTETMLADKPYEQGRRAGYMTPAQVRNIIDFRRKQNLFRYTSNGGDEHPPPMYGNNDRFDIRELLGSQDFRDKFRNNMSGYRWLRNRFLTNQVPGYPPFNRVRPAEPERPGGPPPAPPPPPPPPPPAPQQPPQRPQRDRKQRIVVNLGQPGGGRDRLATEAERRSGSLKGSGMASGSEEDEPDTDFARSVVAFKKARYC